MIAELVAAAALGAAAPSVQCAQRVEGPRPVGPSLPLDLTVGPVTFIGLRYAADAPAAQVARRPYRSAAVVRWGPPVTIVVPPADRPHLRLVWTGGSGYAVTLRPCPPATRARAYDGAVGPRTAFAASFVADGPGCRHLEVDVRGRRPRRVAVAFAGSCR